MNYSLLAGSLLFTMILLSVAAGLGSGVPTWLAGICGWLAALMLLYRVRRLQLVQSVLMLLVGLGCLWLANSAASTPLLLKALSANQALVTMLAAVSFLRLVAAAQLKSDDALPKGQPAFWKTLLGVHLFGSVINLSAMMIMAERFSQKQQMTLDQAATLSRGFGTAALWSPFFVAMGVALTNAPGARIFWLALAGLPIAAIALWLAGHRMQKEADLSEFRGYPLDLASLWLPCFLAVAIMLCHELIPTVPVLTLISLLSILLPLLLAVWRPARISEYRYHIQQVLPNMGSELLLFLSAGVMAVGIATLMSATNVSLGLSHVGATQASGLLVVSLLLSIAGVHPVITVATAGGLLTGLDAPPDLLGLTFLMCWAGGVIASPVSGMHLSLAGRFNISNFQLFMRNRSFSVLLLIVQIAFLHLYEFAGLFSL